MSDAPALSHTQSSEPIQLDQAQQHAWECLAELARELKARHQQKRWYHLSSPKPLQGIYLVGGVGRGKTMLMDRFVTLVGDRAIRLHFHRFMHEVHDELAKYYEQHHQNPLKQVAQNLAKNRTVLCLDDLWVSDITDAMILGQLFEALKNAGLTFVITSNVPINQLYEDGLQRARFLPTIQLLNQMTDTLVVDQGKDYRRFAYGSRALLFVGKNAATDLYHRYKELTHQEQLSGDSILCQNRPMAVLDHSRLTLLIDFKTLCVEARSTTDYIELTNRFEFIAITHLPLLSDDDLDPVRRFIAFVDESYDRKTYLAVAALCDPWDAYQGSRLAREWQRTQSRLHEILSDKWLNRP